MKRLQLSSLGLLIAVTLCFSSFGFAQEGAKPAEHQAAEESHEPGIWWNVANFVILVGILGFLVRKNAGPFFRSRAENIDRALSEGDRAKREGETRVAEMERRIAGLGTEIERLRAQMRQELAAEGERIRLETERHIHRIQEQAEQEIESMYKTARRQLKTYSADLAIQSAGEQLKGRVTRDVENSLVTAFINDLRTSGDGRSTQN